MRAPEGLARRVVTAGALLAAFLGALFLLDARAFGALVALVIALAAYEWGRLTGLGARRAALYGIVLAGLAAAAAWAGEPGWRSALFTAAAGFWLVLVPAWLRFGVARSGPVALAGAGALVLLAAGTAAAALAPVELLLVLGLVWIADTAAYFTGKAYGRRKLAPRISPGKTWEGVAGAAGAILIYAIICALPGAPFAGHAQGAAGWGAYLAGAVLLFAVSIVGDLFESALKRRAGAKDSGALLPGHGGILDRIDSMLPTLPIAVLLLHGPSAP